MTRIIINGANGKMGSLTVETISSQHDMEIVAKTNHEDSLSELIKEKKADIVVDFTAANCCFENTKEIIQAGARPVIGTSGLLPDQVKSLQRLCQENKTAGIIAPNFSIASVLLIKYAQETARYFPDVEIIEMHHNHKQEAPSGTAIKTADMIAKNKSRENNVHPQETEILAGARGAQLKQIPIHSIRLPGLVAHEQIIFGGLGETLTLKHDCIDRQAYMPGVLLACRKVMQLNQLVYGLENIL